MREAVMGGWRILLAGLCLMLAGAGAASAETLRIGLGDDPDMLDPSQARTFTGRTVFAALCDKLVEISPELDIVPQLATEWHWVDDNKGLVLKLRQGVKFHDGEPLDAAAVKFSLERHLPIPDSTVRLANLLSGGLDIVERVAATDYNRLKGDNRVKLSAVTGLGYWNIRINVANGERAKTPFGSDPRVRQALDLAIDRAAL